MSAFKLILQEQRKRVKNRRWSETGSYADYLANYTDNFIHKLHKDVIDAYRTGAGSEIPSEEDELCCFRWHGGKKLPAKIQAIHSSSALVCNAFGYWYDQIDKTALEKAFGCSSPITHIKFEDIKPTGLSGIPPHLDVVIYCDGMVYAIESKFSEPYQGEKKKVVMGSKSYCSTLWSNGGFNACAELVDRINRGEMDGEYKYLSVNQLLKHILGLRNNHEKFELIYLWYEKAGTKESDTHSMEIEAFASLIREEVPFRAITYQDMFSSLNCHCDGNHTSYLQKFSDRYL